MSTLTIFPKLSPSFLSVLKDYHDEIKGRSNEVSTYCLDKKREDYYTPQGRFDIKFFYDGGKGRGFKEIVVTIDRQFGRSILDCVHEQWKDGYVAFQIGFLGTRLDSVDQETCWSQSYDYFGMSLVRFDDNGFERDYLETSSFRALVDAHDIMRSQQAKEAKLKRGLRSHRKVAGNR